jgi:enamine deaminase RidA (YjgF/YER057c/UK114 family)
MADHAIHKVTHEGVGYSVVDLADVRHVLAAASPRRGSTLREQAHDALRTIEAVTRENGTRASIVHQAVFVADAGQIESCRQIIREFYGSDLPATSYIAQPPCEGKLLAIEALGVGCDKGDVEIQRKSEQLVIVRHHGVAWAHCAQVVSQNQGSGVYDGAMSAFAEMRSLLCSAGFRFDQIVRTWLYLGGITDDDGGAMRYRELNRARSDFYRDIPFLRGRLPEQLGTDLAGRPFPASTGIGTQGRGLMLSASALDTQRNDIVAVPLENPRQTAACDYIAEHDPHLPRSPKFCRAMALSCGAYATILISGTASITGEQTRHVDEVAAQTNETLNNIAALISEENLARHGLPGLGTSLKSLGLARIYVKRQADYATIRAICEERLGELPTIYAVADVCRPELLVEIEGIAFARQASIAAAKGV